MLTRVAEQLRIFTTATSTLEEREAALDELNFLTENLDNANDLPKMGGLAPLVAALQDPASGIRERAAWTLGTCAQNNDSFKKLLMASGGVELLLKMLQEDAVPEVRSKALFCMSGLLRNNKDACDEFTRKSGWLSMIKCFRRGDLNLARKLTFILNNFIQEVPAIKDMLIDRDSVTILLDLLHLDDVDLCEKTLTLLHSIMHQSPRNIKAYKEGGADNRLKELATRLRALPRDHQDSYDNTYVLLAQLQSWLQKN